MNPEKLLAKSDGKTLVQHTQDVLDAAYSLLAVICLSKETREKIWPQLRTIAILHDIGKCHCIFQRRMNGEKDTHVFRHEIISAWIAAHYFSCNLTELFAIVTHHKGVIDQNSDNGRLQTIFFTSDLQQHLNGCTGSSDFLRDISHIASFWCQHFQIECKPGHIENPPYELPKDLIQSIRKNKQESLDSATRKEYALFRALLMAADHMASAGMTDKLPQALNIQSHMFQPIDAFSGKKLPFRQFQEQMSEVEGDAILHAPTGSGKTEAAMQWVTRNYVSGTRIFYILPYTASINAMTLRLSTIFGKELVTALHSGTLDFFYQQIENEETNFEIDPVKSAELARTLKLLSNELFFPVKVSTPHQILKRVLMGKGWEFSLVDYSNSIFIFDEFHAYDPFLTALIFATINLLKKVYNAKILFLSATIPSFIEKLIQENIYVGTSCTIVRPDPKHPSNKEILEKKRHKLICQPYSLIDDNGIKDVSIIVNELKMQKKVLMVVNNIATAQELYDIFTGYHETIKIEYLENLPVPTLLHGGFNKKSRSKIEECITSDDPPQFLIATQAVEVSLDIDYDVAFIENAPIDALIQRFGRVNRKGKLQDKSGQVICASIHLYKESRGNISRIYNSQIMERTWETIIKAQNQELAEEDLVQMVNDVYATGYDSIENATEDFQRAIEHPLINNFEQEIVAGHWHDWVEQVIEKDNGLPVDILCGNLVSEYKTLFDQKRYIEADRLTVKVRPWVYAQIQKEKLDGRSNSIVVSHDLEYDDSRGYRRIDKKDSIEKQFL